MGPTAQRTWALQAIRTIEADFRRSADTHLIPLTLPAFPRIAFYLKDESTHPTGSLKHRLARSLFLYALCNGWLHRNCTVVEASSGSTAVSEAYFARLLQLPFIAVMPRSTSREKIEAIHFYGGTCHLVDDPLQVVPESRRLAEQRHGHFMDQFTYAERATDWRSNNNIAESLFAQLALEAHPVPAWVVCNCGTGGTAATIGRYVRYRALNTRVMATDPENSVYFDAWTTRDRTLTVDRASRIEGIGRPHVESSFIPGVIDRMMKVPDALSIGAVHYLSRVLGRRCGGSTGTNLIGALALAREMHSRDEAGSIVTILCDGGDRYGATYFDAGWLRAQGFDAQGALASVQAAAERGAALPIPDHMTGRPTQASEHSLGGAGSEDFR